jgi:type II secretory pathway pseudopilin PulG
MNHLQTSAAKRGFTLVELIVAMAITIIIVGVLVSVTSIATDTWNRSRSELRASRQAKSMVDAMVRDFEALVVRSGNANEWLSAITEADLPGSAGMSSANASKLIFFTSATDRYDGQIGTTDDLGGDVSCVAYQLDYKDPLTLTGSSDFETFVLNRLLVNPDKTFEKLLGQKDLTDALDGLTEKIEDPVNFVCENIYQFTVTFHVEVVDTTKTPAVWSTVPVTLEANSDDPKDFEEFSILGDKIRTRRANETELQDFVGARRVKAMDVSITVLSDMGIDQLRRRTFSDTQQTEFLAKHSYQYSKLVQLPSM